MKVILATGTQPKLFLDDQFVLGQGTKPENTVARALCQAEFDTRSSQYHVGADGNKDLFSSVRQMFAFAHTGFGFDLDDA
jgi:hypothetical protein